MNPIFVIFFSATVTVLLVAIGYVLVLIHSKKNIVREQQTRIADVELREKKYRELFEHSSAGMFKFHTGTFEVYDVNTTGLALFKSADIREFEQQLQNMPNPILRKIKNELQEKKKISDFEILMPDLRWILFSAKSDGMNNAHGVVIDITERKEYEEKIAQQAQLLNETRDAIVVINREGTILFWNKSAEIIYQWLKEEVLGKPLEPILFSANQHESFSDALTESLKSGEWFGESVHKTRQGKELLIDSHWKLLAPKHFNHTMILIINTDITEKRRIEIYSLRAQKLETVALLTSSIAHDLQNILAPVSMSVGLLKDDPHNPTNIQILNEIDKSAQNGLDLVKNVLALGRGLKGEHNKLDIGNIVRDTVDHFRFMNEKDISFVQHIDSNTFYIHGDKQQLKQVFHNLINNAIDAMNAHGTLTVSVGHPVSDIEVLQEISQFEPERFADVTISDNGIGITEEDQKKIFDPFFTTKEDVKGTGLGLAIVQNIVRNHGGLITVESQYRHGSSFHVILPLVEE